MHVLIYCIYMREMIAQGLHRMCRSGYWCICQGLVSTTKCVSRNVTVIFTNLPQRSVSA